MNISEFWDLFLNNILQTTWIEAIAVIFGLLSVWYARKVNILVYPTGIISVLIYVYICFGAQLYADMGINFFYFAMSVFGWYKWTHRDKNEQLLPIRWNTKKEQWIGILAVVILYWAIMGLLYFFKHDDTQYMNSYVPWVDSFTTAVFLVGMWYMALKRIENWIYWIIGDLISVPLYFIKGLTFTSFQYLVFLFIAYLGLKEWIKMEKEQKTIKTS